MKWSIKKISAFTVFELIVTLLISSIVIGISYYSFSLFNRQFLLKQSNMQAFSELALLSKAIKSDFQAADSIEDTLSWSLRIRLKNGIVVGYQFSELFAIRSAGENNTDTFLCTTKMYYPEFYSDSISLISALTLELSIQGETYMIQCNKTYSANQVMIFEKRSNERIY